MSFSSAPLEGVVVVVVDVLESANRIGKALSQAGAAVFVADGDQACRDVVAKVQPHFAVVDPAVTGATARQSMAWVFFSHSDCRTILYSSHVHIPRGETRWLISKDRPVSDVVDAILAAVADPNWTLKGGDDVKPAF